MKETQKQLNNLLREFYDESAARQISRDIEEADRLLADAAPVQPGEELVEHIKQTIGRKSVSIPVRKTFPLRSVLAAAAACLLIGAGWLLYQAVQRPSQAPDKNLAINVNEFFSDETGAKIASDLDEISDQMYVVSSSGWDSPVEGEYETVEEIEEMDLLTNNDFWKG